MHSQQAARERAISRGRLFAFAAAAALLIGALQMWWFSPWWSTAPLPVFVALVIQHQRTRRQRERAARAAAFYTRGLARLDDRWSGGGEPGERFRDEHHPYADDLDLFGRGSLFELLCTARTRAGEETLAAWLKTAAPPDEIRARQVAIAELATRLDLREDLAVLGVDLRAGLHPAELLAWATAPAWVSTGLRITAAALVTITALALVLWATGLVTPLPGLIALSVQGGFGWWLRARVRRVIRTIDRPAHDLALLGELLARLEREHYTAPRLLALRADLDCAGVPPSRQLARLRAWVDWLYARNNELFAPIAGLLLWGTQCALAIEAWRQRSGTTIGRWLTVVGEFEAFCALAGYAYEHPADPFPEIVDKPAGFAATGLGHPLIPEAHCVRNDVHLSGAQQVLIVSGSNMSGKSTLLRAVGTNAVLAQAGAPVRAQALRMSPVNTGAAIRINDSLQAGTSRFYAEITRLRQLVDLTGSAVPLLFLLDEILHGTNSHDRRIGAEAVIKGLVERGAIGLVTTHDLALAQMTVTLGARAHNVHFEDHLEDGKMVFDYRIRSGVVEKSNALALMRAVGLEV
jgi:hypothetical protein